MKKKNKTVKRSNLIRFELNGGGLSIEIDWRGAVYLVEVEGGEFDEEEGEYSDKKFLELSANELDAIAARSAMVVNLPYNLNRGIRDRTRTCGHELTFCKSECAGCFGDIIIGCQCISAEDIQLVHEASLKQRKKNKR